MKSSRSNEAIDVEAKERQSDMQDVKSHTKGSRGSSPPFLESERWLEDGANGAHWVRILQTDPQRPEDNSKPSLDRESDVFFQADGERRWEDDGGNDTHAAGQAG